MSMTIVMSDSVVNYFSRCLTHTKLNPRSFFFLRQIFMRNIRQFNCGQDNKIVKSSYSSGIVKFLRSVWRKKLSTGIARTRKVSGARESPRVLSPPAYRHRETCAPTWFSFEDQDPKPTNKPGIGVSGVGPTTYLPEYLGQSSVGGTILSNVLLKG